MTIKSDTNEWGGGVEDLPLSPLWPPSTRSKRRDSVPGRKRLVCLRILNGPITVKNGLLEKTRHSTTWLEGKEASSLNVGVHLNFWHSSPGSYQRGRRRPLWGRALPRLPLPFCTRTLGMRFTEPRSGGGHCCSVASEAWFCAPWFAWRGPPPQRSWSGLSPGFAHSWRVRDGWFGHRRRGLAYHLDGGDTWGFPSRPEEGGRGALAAIRREPTAVDTMIKHANHCATAGDPPPPPCCVYTTSGSEQVRRLMRWIDEEIKSRSHDEGSARGVARGVGGGSWQHWRWHNNNNH